MKSEILKGLSVGQAFEAGCILPGIMPKEKCLFILINRNEEESKYSFEVSFAGIGLGSYTATVDQKGGVKWRRDRAQQDE